MTVTVNVTSEAGLKKIIIIDGEVLLLVIVIVGSEPVLLR